MTPLAEKLRQRIVMDGPMTVADWMAACLGDPQDGYYMARDPFGRSGDFVTAPEISQMFGEILGAWLLHVWRMQGAPSPVTLLELGPGRGTLMADILRVAARDAAFSRAVSVELLETSPVLRDVQRQTVTRAGRPVIWRTSLADLPPRPLLAIANEFFDALPVRQFVRVAGVWRERVVGLDGAENFRFGLGPGILPDALVEGAGEPRDGDVIEIGEAAGAVMQELAGHVAAHGGAALVIDYGHSGGFGDTLQAVRSHAHADPLAAPGEADLTVHVDFAALKRAALAAGATVHGPVQQGTFLVSLGLLERAGQLGAGRDSATQESLRAAVERLAGADQMGTLFKVLAVTPEGMTPPPFDNV